MNSKWVQLSSRLFLTNFDLYPLECWDGEPDNRPTIYQVIARLKAIFTKTDIITESFQSKLFGMVPYVDPKSFNRQRNNDNQTTQIYSLNEKSDAYSVGVLLWELSSGQPPFYAEGERYDVSLILEISQGLRETVIPDTPEDYVKIYTGNCTFKFNYNFMITDYSCFCFF